MLEIAAAESFLGLLKKLLDIRDSSIKDKRVVFEETVQPLFDALTPIAESYRSAIVEVRTSLDAESVDLPDILKTLSAKRELSVMGRNGVVGAMRGLVVGSEGRSNRSPFETGLDKLLLSIDQFFWLDLSEELNENIDTLIQRGQTSSYQTSLIGQIRTEVATGADGGKGYRGRGSLLYGAAQEAATHLEHGWTEVSQAYSELRSTVYRA